MAKIIRKSKAGSGKPKKLLLPKFVGAVALTGPTMGAPFER
jgi:hypothetical protein